MGILKAARKGTKKSNILYKVGLSSDQLKKYLNALKEADLITDESSVWETTDKGFHVIDACEICQRLIEEIT